MKKSIKRIAMALVCALVLTVAVPTGIGTQTGLVKTVEAAARLTPVKKSLAVGQTSQLYVSGTAGKVTWKSSNSKIVRVSKGGKIRALRKGTATVTAYVDGRSLSCKVTVRKNAISLSESSTPRKTGYYDVGQSGNYLSSIEIQPVWLAYTASGYLKVKYKLYNYSSWNWTNIKTLRKVYISTSSGKVLINKDRVTGSSFSLAPGETKYLTLTFKGSNVKRVVNLNKVESINYKIDIYKNDAWCK